MKNTFNPKSEDIFKLSRSKIELYIDCPRCFYLDVRLGISKPSMPSFSLNSAVDALLKKEFDIHRAKNIAHPLMAAYGIDAVPFEHEKLDEWRQNYKGLQCLHKPTNFLVYGAIDDIWINKKEKELLIVDYKSTSTSEEITLESKWKEVYKRQMEIYQWLAKNNDDLKDYKISDTGYFIFCNGKKDNEAFDGKLEFDVQIIPYKGDSSWVEQILFDIYKCLMSNEIPSASYDCEYCTYRFKARQIGV